MCSTTSEVLNHDRRSIVADIHEINIKGMTQVIAFMAEAGLLKEPLPAAQRFVELKYLQMAGVK